MDSSRFHRGLFEVKQLEAATEIAEACKRFASFPYWKDRGFVIAVYRIIKAGLISIDELVEKYKKYPDTLTKQSGFKNYIFVLEGLYNKGKQSRVVIY